jgi:O-antigen/teichoic acid export membrane protein
MEGRADSPAHADIDDYAGGDPTRRETENQRWDRNLNELLNELRVALPGVQVLFAFLLIVPFNQGWTRMSQFERKLYFGTLLCTALATVLLIAPTMHHRLLFRQHQKRFLVMTANRLAEGGLTVLAVAMTSAIALVTHVEFGGTIATVVVSGVVALCFALIWYAVPIERRRRRHGT